MNCPRHPNKRAIASCKDCGTDFCIECVRETDQTTLCPDCFRRKIDHIAREFTEPADIQEEARTAAAKSEAAAKAERLADKPSLFDEEPAAAPRAVPPAAKKVRFGRKDKARRKKGVSEAPPRPAGPPPLFDAEDIARAETPAAEPRRAAQPGASPAAPRETAPAEAPRAAAREKASDEALPTETPLAAGKKGRSGRESKEGLEKRMSEAPQRSGDFLAQGPDDDFSQLGEDAVKPGRWSLGRKKSEEAQTAEAAEDLRGGNESEEASAADEKGGATTARALQPEPEEAKATVAEKAGLSEDDLLQDVMSTLLKPEAGGGEAMPASAPEARSTAVPAKAGVASKTAKARTREARLRKKEVKALDKEAKPAKERDLERWSFLAQPRSSEYTLIAVSWWKAAIFIILMIMLGAVLWAVPNAYLIPKDQEYGIHAVAIGFIIGLAFWWKAGKKHSTKLAVQAGLTTLFALFIAEFLHWFLIVTKYDAFRTIFFDLVSFRFLWENGADILRYTMEAMFPIAFLWLLFLPTVTAFIIGFGMPPIPEIFIQIWHAFKGEATEKKEATRGLEG